VISAPWQVDDLIVYLELCELVAGFNEDGLLLYQFTIVEFKDESIKPDERVAIESALKVNLG
jgi:hypothetical protein